MLVCACVEGHAAERAHRCRCSHAIRGKLPPGTRAEGSARTLFGRMHLPGSQPLSESCKRLCTGQNACRVCLRSRFTAWLPWSVANRESQAQSRCLGLTNEGLPSTSGARLREALPFGLVLVLDTGFWAILRICTDSEFRFWKAIPAGDAVRQLCRLFHRPCACMCSMSAQVPRLPSRCDTRAGAAA